MKSKDDIMSGYKAIFEDGYRAGRASVVLPHPCDGELYKDWTAAQLERDKFGKQTAAFLAGATVGAATQGAVGLAGRLVPIVTGTSRMGARIAEKVGERPVVKGLIEGSVREGTQETTEQIAQNLAAGQIYDPERRALEGVGMAGGAGAVVGGLFGGGAGAMARRRSQLRPTPAEAQVAPASADALDQLIDELARAPVATTPTDEEAITAPLEVPMEVPTAPEPTPAGTAAITRSSCKPSGAENFGTAFVVITSKARNSSAYSRGKRISRFSMALERRKINSALLCAEV